MSTHTYGQLLELPPRRPAALDVVQGKLRVPPLRTGSVRRTALINRLRGARTFPVVSIVAPAGYGKTTLLAQWVERDERPYAWVSLDRRDDDPKRFLLHLAAAIDAIAPLGDAVLDALHTSSVSIWRTLVPRFSDALVSLAEPTIIVLDDIGRISSYETLEIVSALAHQLPGESTLALAGRTEAGVRVGTLRADGLVLEIGADLLSMNRHEGSHLLAASGVELSDAELTILLDRTEGWAAGLYLAARALRDRATCEATPFSGADRNIADYLRAEYLQRLSGERLEFLRRTSIVDSLCGSLCDALLERSDSAYVLEAIEREDLFLVPLDRRREWFRYRHLFREFLLHDLEQHDPGELAGLNARAAAWYEERGDLAAAVAHLIAANSPERAAQIACTLVPEACDADRMAEAEGVIAAFDGVRYMRDPVVTALDAWLHLLRGHETEATRLVALGTREAIAWASEARTSAADGVIALVRAALCLESVGQMLVDARNATDRLPPGSRLAAVARMLEGVAQSLAGELDLADATLRRAIQEASAAGAAEALVTPTAQRALIAADTGNDAAALALTAEAGGAARHGGVSIGNGVLELALSARELLRRGSWQLAVAELETAEAAFVDAAPAPGWLAVQAALEIARVRIALNDLAAAGKALEDADRILERHPQLWTLRARAAGVRALVSSDNERQAGFTRAELRLLPLLATHLSFREIGARLYVSRNTIKTQALSVYRKLGVSSRSEAIERATEIGLLAGRVPPQLSSCIVSASPWVNAPSS